MKRILHSPRALSVLCLTCVNHGVEPGDAHGKRKCTEVCSAGVKRLRDRLSCESYVRLFERVPFLTEHQLVERPFTERRARPRRAARAAAP